MGRHDLSVVVACMEADIPLDRCLAALKATCDGLNAEVILVYPGDAPPRCVEEGCDGVRTVTAGVNALVPELWAKGLRASCGRVVAFSTAHCVVGPSWAPVLLDAIQTGATGAGGAIELDRHTTPLDWAIYFLRFSSFMPPVSASEVVEIPGDNAAYSRAALERYGALQEAGFWEVEFHQRIRPEGKKLVMAPGATATYCGSLALGTILRHRFLHARRFGLQRADAGVPRWRIVLAAPVVPWLLAVRAVRRAARRRYLLFRAVLSLPLLILIAAAWATGEAVGAWRCEAVGKSLTGSVHAGE